MHDAWTRDPVSVSTSAVSPASTTIGFPQIGQAPESTMLPACRAPSVENRSGRTARKLSRSAARERLKSRHSAHLNDLSNDKGAQRVPRRSQSGGSGAAVTNESTLMTSPWCSSCRTTLTVPLACDSRPNRASCRAASSRLCATARTFPSVSINRNSMPISRLARHKRGLINRSPGGKSGCESLARAASARPYGLTSGS